MNRSLSRTMFPLLFMAVLLAGFAHPLAASAASAAESSQCSVVYVVQRGDTLYRIARTHLTTVQRLKTLNQLPNANRIYVGQHLCISPVVTPPWPGQWYTVQRGDTLSAIARAHGLGAAAIAAANQLVNPNRIYAGQRLWLPAPGTSGQWYRVQRGDTVAALARKYHSRIDWIVFANGLANANHIRAGQKLYIPYQQ